MGSVHLLKGGNFCRSEVSWECVILIESQFVIVLVEAGQIEWTSGIGDVGLFGDS